VSLKQLFDQHDSAKLKNQKSLNAEGEFLANNEFGFAVVVALAGTVGDTQKELVLGEARAMVVREYLVENFGFDDSQLKILGMGKQTGGNPDAGWGRCRFSSIRLEPRSRPKSKLRWGSHPKQSWTNRFRLLRPHRRNHSSGYVSGFEQTAQSVDWYG
jgi:hypothetical protein